MEERPWDSLPHLDQVHIVSQSKPTQSQPLDWEPYGAEMDLDLVPSDPEDEGEPELSSPSPPPRWMRRRTVRTPSDSPTPQATRVEPIPPDDAELNAEAAAKARALVSSLPFTHHFKSLDAAKTQAAETLVLRRQPLDVDMWEIAMSPEEYGSRFSSVLASVELACHTTGVPSGRNGHEPEFKGWIMLGKNNHQLWVHPDIKGPFFDELCKRRVVFESTSPLIATYGSPMIPVREFTRCLVKARCQTLWIKAYGQKLPIGTGPLDEEPAQADHPKAEHNQWDIGVNFKSPSIWLWGNAATNKSLTTYPMLTPASLDLGSVMGEITYNRTCYGFKVYPRLVHAIKAFKSRLQGDIPKTLRGVKTKVNAALEVIRFFSTVDPNEMGGFRIELTVGARSLSDARDLVQATPLLTHDFWLHPPDNYAAYKLNATVVSKDGLLANADWVFRQCTLAQALTGTDRTRPSSRQVQMMSDVLAAFGWNAGKRRLTKSLAPNAWWIMDERGDGAEGSVLAAIQTKYNSPATKSKLAAAIRRHHSNYIPCRVHPTEPKHRYHVHSRSPFRLRCPLCGSHLTSGEAMKWFAQLIATGRVPRAAAALDDEPQDGTYDDRGQESDTT